MNAKLPSRLGMLAAAMVPLYALASTSRLRMPLVNELVIGLPDQDKFNASKPGHDGQRRHRPIPGSPNGVNGEPK